MQQAAERLGVSPARVRQRIDAGSLVSEKIGGRWLVDLEASQSAPARVGRPVSPSSVWWSLAAAEIAKDAMPIGHVTEPHQAAGPLLARMRIAESVLADLDPHPQPRERPEERDLVAEVMHEAQRMSRSSRDRAVHRLADTVGSRDHHRLLAWLGYRASRRLFVAAQSDSNALRDDPRLFLSGLSDPRAGMGDLRVLEGYVKTADVDAIAADYWLERPGVDERPNVVLHVSPVRPPEIGPMLLAADLSEHAGPREAARAHELLDEAIDALLRADEEAASA